MPPNGANDVLVDVTWRVERPVDVTYPGCPAFYLVPTLRLPVDADVEPCYTFTYCEFVVVVVVALLCVVTLRCSALPTGVGAVDAYVVPL